MNTHERVTGKFMFKPQAPLTTAQISLTFQCRGRDFSANLLV